MGSSQIVLGRGKFVAVQMRIKRVGGVWAGWTVMGRKKRLLSWSSGGEGSGNEQRFGIRRRC